MPEDEQEHEQEHKNDIVDVDKLQKSYGTNWENGNEDTLHEWVSIGSYHIKLLECAIEMHRQHLRANAIFGIVLSTLTGTISAAQFNNYLTVYFSLLLTFFSYIVAISGGYMKVFQIQEQLEEYIKVKQEWIDFSTLIVAELQLPVQLRQDAAFLIWKYKGQYVDLLKMDVTVSRHIRNKVGAVELSGNGSTIANAHLSGIIQHINNIKNQKDIKRKHKEVTDKFVKIVADAMKQAKPGQNHDAIAKIVADAIAPIKNSKEMEETVSKILDHTKLPSTPHQ